MPKYRTKSIVVEAHQWFKNGDHPRDACHWITNKAPKPFLSEGRVVRRFCSPTVKGDSHCHLCGQIMNDHGWLDRNSSFRSTVCPGDWVVTGPQQELFACQPDELDRVYEPVEDEETVTPKFAGVKAVQSLIELQCQHGNWNSAPYMHGLANGMICALAVLEDKDAEYLDAPKKWLSDKSEDPFIQHIKSHGGIDSADECPVCGTTAGFIWNAGEAVSKDQIKEEEKP